MLLETYQNEFPLRSFEHPFSMLSHIFHRLARSCASHPWEIIIAFLTLISWRFSIGNASKICTYDCTEENKGVELVLLTIARCVAIFFCIHQFLKLKKLGSTFLVGIGAMFAFFCFLSCIIFIVNTSHLIEGDFTELNKALPFFFLLMDIKKAGLLAQFALSSATQEEVLENIAQGMSIIGPTVTLDTIVETLVIGVGTLSGISRLEELCRFACMSAVINYIMFMVFFPACLSLILELSRKGTSEGYFSTLTKYLQTEEEQKPNPVVQRVKLIMSAGLVLVHARSRLQQPVLIASKALQHAGQIAADKFAEQPASWDLYMLKFGSAGQMVFVAVVCTLGLIYHFMTPYDDLSEHLAIASPAKRPYQKPQTLKAPARSIVSSNPVTFIVGPDPDVIKPVKSCDREIQTEYEEGPSLEIVNESSSQHLRTIEECKEILKSEEGASALLDDEVLILAEKKVIAPHNMENLLHNPKRGVRIRRKLISKLSNRGGVFHSLPYEHYDFRMVMGSCCENVIGYVPIPVGVAGPLIMDGEKIYVPMATTEGCLVASTNRGCRALALSGGVRSSIESDGMTRAPVIELPSMEEARQIKQWIKIEKNFCILKSSFDATSRFAKLLSIEGTIAGRLLFLRFKAFTGDAMGMNMLSKGCEKALSKLKEIFPNVFVLSISGNYCTDKKPAAINWVLCRGKEVNCSALIPAKVVKEVLKTDVHSMMMLNVKKNYIGSQMAGSIGGFNAHAANVVTAIFIATGQDPAQNVTSSYCLTQIWETTSGDLEISCKMPAIEVGTVGGGTFLPPQSSCLQLLGLKGPCLEKPGENAAKLARVVCSTVLAGELSLLAAQAEGHLVRSHMTHNRSSANVTSSGLASCATSEQQA